MVVGRCLVAAVLLAAFGTPVGAELCVIDAVPAATILVPYFEVNFKNFGKGKFENTRVTLINTDDAPSPATERPTTTACRRRWGRISQLIGLVMKSVAPAS